MPDSSVGQSETWPRGTDAPLPGDVVASGASGRCWFCGADDRDRCPVDEKNCSLELPPVPPLARPGEHTPRGQRITHGRHCTCSACAHQDWTEPDFAPCGMHGADCPALYQPWGPAGTCFDPSRDTPSRGRTMPDHGLRSVVSRAWFETGVMSSSVQAADHIIAAIVREAAASRQPGTWDGIAAGLDAYHAVNLLEALKLVPDTGDWHGSLRQACAIVLRDHPDAKPNQTVEQMKAILDD